MAYECACKVQIYILEWTHLLTSSSRESSIFCYIFKQNKRENTSSTSKLREQWGRQGMAAQHAWEDFYSDKSAGASEGRTASCIFTC